MMTDILEMAPDMEMIQGLQAAQSAGHVAVRSEQAMEPIITAQPVAVHRDLSKVMRDLKILAAAAGTGWFYRYPVNSKEGRKSIEGPSIKLANDLVRIYGNCAVDVRAFDQGDHWIFYGKFVDYESGFSMTRAFQQRKSQSSVNSKDQGRQLDIAFQIGQSKAIRNVVVNALQTLADFAFDEARNGLVEKIGKNVKQYRDKCAARLEELGVALKRVEKARSRSIDSWLADDIAKVVSEIQSVNDGMATADEIWPPIEEEAPAAPKKAAPKKEPEKPKEPEVEEAEVVEEDSPASDEKIDEKAYIAQLEKLLPTIDDLESLSASQETAKAEAMKMSEAARGQINTMFLTRFRELSK